MELAAVITAGIAIVGFGVLAAYQAGRAAELGAVAGCMANDHAWRLMTAGRAGFVRWYHCQRPGCTATRFVKGGRA